MVKKNKTQISLLILGIFLFAYTLYFSKDDALKLLGSGLNSKYLLVYVGITIITIGPMVWRWQVILSGYGKKVGFWTLARIQLAGSAVSYVTPSARIGGEPLRIYMLKKDCGVNYKTGTASVVLDKYMEYLGSLVFGITGLVLLSFVPNIPGIVRVVLAILIVFTMSILGVIYYRLNHDRGFFLSLFSVFLSKKRLRKMSKNLKNIDKKLSYFIVNHKKEFFFSFLFYALSAVLFLLEFKFLLLGLGVSTTFLDVLLVGIVVGLANIVPLPMALGSLEAGQSGLFELIKGDGGIGLILSLIVRIRGLFFSLIGFLLIIVFSGKDILKKSKERKLD